MTDIVTRLRADARGGYAQYWRETAAEAADEIERLTALLEAKTTPGYELLAGTIEKMEADNERLREENANLRRWKALDKPLAAAMAIANSHLEQARRALEPKP